MEKIKQFFRDSLESEKGKDILIVIIVILVGLSCFGLGRLSKNNQNSGIKILPGMVREYPNQESSQSNNAVSSLEHSNILQNDKMLISNKNFFASSRGSKYYGVSCSAGKTIKQENRVYFTTKEEAEKAGYELSSSCR